MPTDHDPIRRAMFAAIAAAAPLGTVAAPATARTGAAPSGARSLVAYFSRSGNTRVIAGVIHRGLDSDLLEIQPATPYPEDYFETVEQARKERDGATLPALRTPPTDLASYDTLFPGFPIWGETVPPVVRSFLSTLDLSGKTVIPFLTHGGYGPGDSRSVLTRLAARATLLPSFVMEADQERRTTERVTQWLEKTSPARP